MQRIVKYCLPLYIIDNGLFNLFPDLRQILFHAFRIFILNDFEKVLQLCPDIGYLARSARVEQDFLKQVVVFAEQSFGNGHVFFESSSGAS